MYLQGRSEEQEEPDSAVTLEPPDHMWTDVSGLLFIREINIYLV